MKAYDNFGNIIVVKFEKGTSLKEKKQFAKKLLKQQKGVRTVLEKKERIKGRLRKLSTNYIAGEKTKEVLYKENGCILRFNIDDTYFSPRLSNERKEIASEIKKGEIVLVMFAGVAPYSIVIAKLSKAKKVFSNEINRKANEYAKLNIRMNKVKDRIELVNGDAKKIHEKLCKGRLSEGNRRCPRFDVIVMPRPQLKETFLKEAFLLSKKGTRIYYYDFCKENEIDSVVEKIKSEASKAGKKIKVLKKKRAGELAPYKIRLRVDFQVI